MPTVFLPAAFFLATTFFLPTVFLPVAFFLATTFFLPTTFLLEVAFFFAAALTVIFHLPVWLRIERREMPRECNQFRIADASQSQTVPSLDPPSGRRLRHAYSSYRIEHREHPFAHVFQRAEAVDA